jgi:DNA-binding PadR family transcriptional regulator
MSQTSDERFQELATKLVSFECFAEEKAELRRIIDQNPARREELQSLCLSVGMARELLPLVNALEATEGHMSAGEMEAFKAALAQRREEKRQNSAAPFLAVPATVQQQVLTRKEMEALVLKVLAGRPMDGLELTRCLEKASMKPMEGGEGAIYGLLGKLEASGHLEGRWREQGARMVKTYHITEKAGRLLEGEKGKASQLNAWSQAVLDFHRS